MYICVCLYFLGVCLYVTFASEADVVQHLIPVAIEMQKFYVVCCGLAIAQKLVRSIYTCFHPS